jgi:hypothetical protein
MNDERLLNDTELCSIIATANSRDYSEIEFIGHVSIAQDRKTVQAIIKMVESVMVGAHTGMYGINISKWIDLKEELGIEEI